MQPSVLPGVFLQSKKYRKKKCETSCAATACKSFRGIPRQRSPFAVRRSQQNETSSQISQPRGVRGTAGGAAPRPSKRLRGRRAAPRLAPSKGSRDDVPTKDRNESKEGLANRSLKMPDLIRFAKASFLFFRGEDEKPQAAFLFLESFQLNH